MRSDSQEALKKLLEIEAKKTARQLGLRESDEIEILDFEFVQKTLGILEDLASTNDEASRMEFIAISALLWTHASDKFSGVRNHLIVLLAKIGYSPSSSMLNKCPSPASSTIAQLEPIHSLIFELETCAYDQKHTIEALGHRFLITEFQKRVWDKTNSSSVLGISAPTSAGKSFILALSSLSQAINNDLDILYIVPTLSLVNQVTEDYASLVSKFADGPSRIIILNSFADYQAEVETNERRIYVMTQERALASAENWSDYFRRSILLIADEIQNIERALDDTSGERSRKLLDLLTDLSASKLVSQAVISGPRINDIESVASSLFQNRATEVSTDTSPVLNLTYAFKQAKGSVYLHLKCAAYEGKVSLPLDIESIPGYSKKRYQDDILDFLADLAERLGRDTQTIIFSPTASTAQRSAGYLSTRLAITGDNRDLSNYLATTIHPKYPLAEYVLYGIAYHHGKLPKHARKAIEHALGRKQIKLVACTTTLLQGVNLPASNIIIRNPNLYINKSQNSVELSSYELANLRGRVGRLMKDFVGRAFVLDEGSFEETDSYTQDSLFEDTYKSLDTDYASVFSANRNSIIDCVATSRLASENDEAPSHIAIYIRQAALKYGKQFRSVLEKRGIVLTKSEADQVMRSLSDLAVSPDVCARNRYVDPIALERMLTDSLMPLLPENPNDPNLSDSLNNLLLHLSRQDYYAQRIEQELGSKIVNTKRLQVLATYASQWTKGCRLAKMLANPFINSHPDQLDSAIGMIEGKVAYSLPNLLAPIYGAKSVDAIILTCMEAGSFDPFVRKLMDLGIARETALRIQPPSKRKLGSSNDAYLNLVEYVKFIAPSLEKWDRIQIPFLEHEK